MHDSVDVMYFWNDGMGFWIRSSSYGQRYLAGFNIILLYGSSEDVKESN